jgi:hypothetical protein
LDILALRTKTQSSRRNRGKWTRAHCMCPYHHKPSWNTSLCASYFCGLQHYVLYLKQHGKFVLKCVYCRPLCELLYSKINWHEEGKKGLVRHLCYQMEEWALCLYTTGDAQPYWGSYVTCLLKAGITEPVKTSVDR